MGVEFAIWNYLTFFKVGIGVFALICCFFGYKLYRVIGAFTAFFVTALVICRIFGDDADQGVIATTFVLAGLLMAFLALSQHKGTSVILSFLAGVYAIDTLGGGWLLCIAAGLALAALVYRFGIQVMIIITAVFGGISAGSVIAEAFLEFANAEASSVLMTYGIHAILVALGTTVQFFMNRRNFLVRSKKQYKMRRLGEIKEINKSYVPKYAREKEMKSQWPKYIEKR